MFNLTMPPLREADPSCYHHWLDAIDHYLLRCEKCDGEILYKTWKAGL